MANKLFFCDPSSELSRSYLDLWRDVTDADRNQSATTECYDCLVCLFAAILSDSRITIASPQVSPTAHRGAISVNSASAMGGNSSSAPRLSQLSDAVLNSQARIGLLTSGTTGQPNLVEHQMQSLTRSVRIGEKHADDVWGLAYHPARFAGLQVTLQAVCNHNPLIKLFDLPIDSTHAAIDSHRITHLSATPTFYRLLCAASTVHERVQRITVGGEIFDHKLLAQLRRTFPTAKILNVFASTETGSLFAADDDCFTIPEELSALVRIEDGELLVHRSLIAESLQNQCLQEFYATGDCVSIVNESPLQLRITSRRRELINVGGSKVNPHEVERVLLEIDEIAAARVYGRKNSVTGNLVCCDIVASQGMTIDKVQLRKQLESRLQAYQIPRFVNVVAEISATDAGKTRRIVEA